jgi:acetyltransferase
VFELESLSASTFAGARDDLIDLLRACVDGGASVGFLAPLPVSDANEYWASLTSQLQAGSRALVVARDRTAGTIVASGQLAFETKPNGRHRAEVNKVMVLPSYRRRGIAAQIMRELERIATARGTQLLFLDTSEGAGGAQAFYETLGYTYAGGIPNYALDPDGRPAKNAIYYKFI